MAFRFIRFSRNSVFLACFSLLLSSAVLFALEQKVEFLTLADVSETLQLFADSGIPGSDIAKADQWDRWIREQDAQVRSRIDRGVEDSISNLILYGTSYTDLPRMENAESAISNDGKISPPAAARVHALVVAVAAASPAERIRIVRDYLKKKGIAPSGLQQFLTANLQRFVEEQAAYQRTLIQAEKSGDIDQKLSTRGTLYQTRGLSADTSLLVNYALEDTLRSLSEKGVLAEGQVRRIAVIGPGLDFTNKHNGYDFYPLQSIQPFAVMESALRLKLASPDHIEVFTLDLNPWVNAHILKFRQQASTGRPYTLQLPRDTSADWPTPAVEYWQQFGEVLGTSVKPIPVPQTLGGVSLRAVAVAPRFASRVIPLDMNVVTQGVGFPEGRGFDLVVATNILVYYDRFQQGLAMASIARMMNPGGIFLSNDALSAHHTKSLEFLDRHTVSFATKGPYGDNVLAYRRR